MNKISASLAMAFSLLMVSCSGGDDLDNSGGCDGACASTSTQLSTDDVEQILAQAIQEARAQDRNATIAVSDRVGNILAVYRMGDASDRVVLLATEATKDLNGNNVVPIDSGLEGIQLPTVGVPLNIDDQAAISKAITGAYLSSEGNAFSTRTASQIIQENFNPGEQDQPSGPLFGVQFSQLSCSDFTIDSSLISIGPKRAPLGLSADPGGFPLYKNGTVVGGVGVIADGPDINGVASNGLYSIDKLISDNDNDVDEIIALAGANGFYAPENRVADRITVEGKTLRFSDAVVADMLSNPNTAPLRTDIESSIGSLVDVFGYTDASVRAGLTFGQAESGIRAATTSEYPSSLDGVTLDAHIFVDASNTNRYPAIDGTDSLLAAAEVQAILEDALTIANRARAQIRQPLGSQARVSIAIVDTNGVILGMVRSRDAPIFGSDVAVQKARTATFYSSAGAADFLNDQPPATYFDISDTALALTTKEDVDIGAYVTDLQTFVANSGALTNGLFAYSDRAGGNLSRPFYPDGLSGSPAGPLSKENGSWSVFSTGIQLDLVFNGIIQHVLNTASADTVATIPDVTDQCTGVDFDPENLTFSVGASVDIANISIANGIQIFPGSVPIYRGEMLIGGIGVSGDGVDQDDMISFLGVHNAGLRLGSVGNAPIARRADNLTPQDVRQRFIQCPQAPFLDSDEDNVCEGK